jgi:predicted outer membrane protein
MKTNFRRSVSAAVILTPAALLAACSTSEGWKSTKSDSTNSRSTGYSSDSRGDGYYTATDRTHTTADGRRVTTRYYSNDPYGDGVSGGPGTNAMMSNDGRAVSYNTRTNERNNSNWRDGPTRYDNENPSQDNSSSQYNTGISRNQNPAEGTVNNQNLAKGSVQPQNSQGWYENRGTRIDNTDTRWQNEQRMNQQTQQNQQSNPNWQANNQQWNNQQQNAQQGNQQWDSRQQAARNEGSSSTNPSNSNAQYGQQNWQSGDQSGQQNQNWANRNQNSTGMNQGSNQNWNQNNQSTNPNWNQNNQQLPPRDAQGNWIQRNLDTSNMTTQDQQAAARQMSNPATNPSNSNAQFNQDNSGQYSSTQGNQQQNWQSGQQNQTGSNRDQNWNQGNQNTNPNWNNNQASNSNWNQNNQNSNQNSNQGWNQNNQQRDAQGNWIQRNLDTTNMTTPDQQAAARQMSDPGTNPSNSNAQFNQNNSGQYATNQSNQDYSNRTYPVQSGQNQNQNPNRNYANQTTTNSTPNNGVERVGPQNNWGTDGAHTDNTNVSSGSQANRTNQANSNQANSNQANANQPYSSRSTDMNAAGQSQVFASSATADQKILSLLHFNNQKEIELGRLAASQGSSAAVKDYGNMLVREHTAADARVMAVASQTGTTLMSDTETQNMIRAEKAAMGKDGTADKNADRTNDDRAKMADGTKEMKDPMEELRGLKGAEFDRVFAQNMVKGHQKLIAAIQKAQPQVKNEQTRQLLNEMLPTLQMHERTARQLPGFTETANAR